MNNKYILISSVLLILAVNVNAEPGGPLPATYRGYVTIDGKLATSAYVSVYNSTGQMPPQQFLFDNGSYSINVAWDDPATAAIEGVFAGETITFKVNGFTARTWTVSEADNRLNENLDLEIVTSSTPASVSSGGGSSGGGGGGASAEPYENVVKKETTKEETLAKDIPKNFSFTATELPVSEISITSNINTGLLNIQVELLKNRSNLAKEDAPGNIYKYVNIWVRTSGFAVPKNIKEGIIRFRIENSWMTSNGFTDADIVMLRWDETQWLSLVTEKTGSDGEYTHFEAKTNSFSPFAISGARAAPMPTATNVSPSPTEQQGSPAPSQVKQSSDFGLVLAIAGLMLVVLKKRRY